MKQNFVRLGYQLAYYLGIIAMFYYLNRNRQTVIIYHNILPDSLRDKTGMSHSASAFEKHLEIINRRWPQDRPERAATCLITFDDGYVNQHEVAAEILERHDRRAIFFVTLDLILNRKMLWPDGLMMWLSYAPDGIYRLLGESVTLGNGISRSQCWRQMWNRILANYDCAAELQCSMNAAFPFDRLPIDHRLKTLRLDGMTLEQVADLARRGHRVGCHSYHHDVLALLSDAALAEDFARCEAALGNVFSCDYYCYPFGGPNEVTERERIACRNSRFSCAFLDVEIRDAGVPDDPYAIPRITLPDTTDRYVIEAILSGFAGFLRRLLPGSL